MIYKKWRDLSIDPFDIKFNKIKIKEIISYPPAGNDVIEVLCIYNNKEINAFIKIVRSKVEGFDEEVKVLSILNENNLIKNIPKVIEYLEYDDKKIIVLTKLDGERLSDILAKDNKDREIYLYEYGNSLGDFHKISNTNFNISKKRIINDYPKKYLKADDFISFYITYLEENNIEKNDNTFIHGDYHYANILWDNKVISGILDFEYSGMGFKEQDIAWSIILRPTQHFMDTKEDIITFLKGYRRQNLYDKEKLKWCLINGYTHFYLMNIDNEEYINKLKYLIEITFKDELI